MKQRKTIVLTLDGSFPKKGKVHMERKITPQTMAKVITVVAEDVTREAEEKKAQRMARKQQKQLLAKGEDNE